MAHVCGVHVQRDVLGITRSAVPILVGQGIQAVTVGTNGGCAPPAVPHNTPFRWRDEQSGTELLSMWHPGGDVRPSWIASSSEKAILPMCMAAKPPCKSLKPCSPRTDHS